MSDRAKVNRVRAALGFLGGYYRRGEFMPQVGLRRWWLSSFDGPCMIVCLDIEIHSITEFMHGKDHSNYKVVLVYE